MEEENISIQDQQLRKPNAALKALEVMVGIWDLIGRDFTTNEEIRGQSTFEWLEGAFFLVHRFRFDYAGRVFAGIEYIGYDEKTEHLKTHVFSDQGPDPLQYTWEVDEHTFTTWFRDVRSDNRYQGKSNEDRTMLIGQWEWPGRGYEVTMRKVR